MPPVLFAGSPYAHNDALCFLVAVICGAAVSRHYILEHREMRKPFMISLVAGIVIGFLVMVQDGFREYPDLQTGRLVIGAIGAILGFGLTALRYKGKKPKSPQDS